MRFHSAAGASYGNIAAIASRIRPVEWMSARRRVILNIAQLIPPAPTDGLLFLSDADLRVLQGDKDDAFGNAADHPIAATW